MDLKNVAFITEINHYAISNFIASNFGGKMEIKRPQYMSSDSESETDKENTGSIGKRQHLDYSSDEDKTVETPSRF